MTRLAIWRTQLLPVSAMKRSLVPLIARLEGAFSATLPVIPGQAVGTSVEGRRPSRRGSRPEPDEKPDRY